MANINLDIKSIRSNVMNTEDKLKNFNGDIDKFLTMLTNVDTAWNDATTASFIKTIGKDRELFNELVKAISNQINVTTAFCDDLENTLAGQFNISTLFNVKYIESSTERSVELLSEISKRINDVKNNISTLSIPATSSRRSEISSLLADIDANSVNGITEKIRNAISSINKTIENARYNSTRFGKYEMDSSTMSFNSSIKAPELKRDNKYEEARVSIAKAVAKAELINAKTPDDITEVSFNEKTEKKDLGDIQHNQNFTEATFVDKRGVFNLNDKKDEDINSNFVFNEKARDAHISDTEAEKIKEYDFNKKDILAKMAEKANIDIKDDYSKKDSRFDADLNIFNKVDTKEYQGPSNDTSKILFESGVPTARVSEYEGPSKDPSKALFGNDIPGAQAKEYELKNSVASADLGNISTPSGVKEYSFDNNSVSASLNNVETSVADKYSFTENRESTNLRDDGFNINSRQYDVNDDNIIE